MYWSLRHSKLYVVSFLPYLIANKVTLVRLFLLLTSTVPIAKINNLLVGKDCPHSRDRKIGKVRYLLSGLQEGS